MTLEVKDHWKNSPLKLLIINPYKINGLFPKTIYLMAFGPPGMTGIHLRLGDFYDGSSASPPQKIHLQKNDSDIRHLRLCVNYSIIITKAKAGEDETKILKQAST